MLLALLAAMDSSREEVMFGLAVTSRLDRNVRTTLLDYRAVIPEMLRQRSGRLLIVTGRVAEKGKADASLNPRACQFAVQLVLAVAIKSRSSTPTSSDPLPIGTP